MWDLFDLLGFVASSIFLAIAGFTVLYLFLTRHRDRKVLARLKCQECGIEYGEEAARKAEDQFEKDLRTSLRGRPLDSMIYIIFEWTVVCPHCHARAKYDVHKLELITPGGTPHM